MAGPGLFKRLFGGTTGSGERRQQPRIRARDGLRVLVVDDSITIQAVLAKMLGQNGYEVLKAGDGEQGVALARSEQPDLVFLDIVMPGISGFEVLRQLRRDELTREIPIIMISGNMQATEQFYVQRFGADDFMKKPFGRGEVFARIAQLVAAGRIPGMEMPEAADGVETDEEPPVATPAGMSQAEFDAIPDVAMPDERDLAGGAEVSPPTVR